MNNDTPLHNIKKAGQLSSPGTKLPANFAVPPFIFSRASSLESRTQPSRLHAHAWQPEMLLLSFNGDEPGPSTPSSLQTGQWPAQGRTSAGSGREVCSQWPSLSGACSPPTFPLRCFFSNCSLQLCQIPWKLSTLFRQNFSELRTVSQPAYGTRNIKDIMDVGFFEQGAWGQRVIFALPELIFNLDQ